MSHVSFTMLIFSHAMMSTVGVRDFNLMDVIQPESSRFQHHASALINFFLFRLDQQETVAALDQQAQEVVEDQKQHQQCVSALHATVQKLESEPILKAREEREREVGDLTEKAGVLRKESEALRGEIASAEDKVAGVSSDLEKDRALALSLKDELAHWHSLRVRHAGELRSTLTDRSSSIQDVKASISILVPQRHALDQRQTALSTLLQQIEQHITRMKVSESDMVTLENLKRTKEELSSTVSRFERELAELNPQLDCTVAEIDNLMKELKLVQTEFLGKQTEADSALGSMSNKIHDIKLQQDAERVECEKLRMLTTQNTEKSALIRAEHNARVSSLLNQFEALNSAVVISMKEFRTATLSAEQQ